MNTQLYTEMWDRFPGKSSQRMLMLAIAWASDEKGTCRLTTKELATSARMSRTNVWRLVGELERTGWIEVEPPLTESGPVQIQLASESTAQRLEEPQPVRDRSRCRGRKSQQEEMIFLPAVIEPAVPADAFGHDQPVYRPQTVPQRQEARKNSYDARPFGLKGKPKRW